MSDNGNGQNKGASQGEQFDITDVGTEDIEALASSIESFYKKDTTQKTQLSYAWERNHMFLDGKQWLVYDSEYNYGGLWKQLNVSRANEYIPRPVTNFIFDNYQTLKSYLIKNKPRSQVKANTQTYKDKTAARLADLCLETNWERLKEEYNYEYAAAVGLTYGTCIKKDYWDTSATGLVKVPKSEQRPQIDPMTGQTIGMIEVASTDEFGQPIFDELPLGDVNTCIVEPQRFALDPLANNLHEARWVMEFSIQPLQWIQEVFGKEGNGYTGKAFDVKEETSLNGSLKRYYQLKTSSGVKNKMEAMTSSGSEEGIVNSAVVKEYYERPSLKYPKGRMVVVANAVTLYASDSPYEGPELGDWHPYSEFRYEIVPGRFWGKGPIENGVEIQKRINSIDSVVILTRKTMAVPQKLIPTSSGIAHGSWTGRPGQEIYYRATDGGAAPQTIPGVGVDGSVFAEREQAKNDLKEVMGAIDILKGDRPPGVTAASALEMLYEVGAGKLYPMLDRWKRFVETSQKKQLRIIAKNYKEPREDYIKSLKAKNTDLSEEMINKFIGADLYDNCNVIVEAGSNIPKLLSAQKARLAEAAQVGVLSLDKPENRSEYQKQMGITGFDNDVGPDQKRAEWENDLLDNVDHAPFGSTVLAVDNDEIHMEVLGRRMKEPSFISASQAVQQAYMQHYQAHMDADSQKKQAAMLEAASTGQPPGPQGPQPSRPIPAGTGPSHDQQKALDSDLDRPGTAPR